MRGSPAAVARVRAPAKVNLALGVGARRPDGFHEIDTVFQMVDFGDDVTVELMEPGAEVDGVELVWDGPAVGPPEENLAVRAARAFLRAAELRAAVRVRVKKRIPAGAGLGGGSSDAAAVLRALAALAPGTVADDGLRTLAAELGSDVPFFLCGSVRARGRGRGEILEPLAPLPACDVALVLPPVHVSTAWAYGALARPGADAGQEPADTTTGAYRVDAAAAASSWSDVVATAHNDFQTVVASAHPAVAAALEALSGAGYPSPLLSGSGGACLGLDPAGAANPEELEEKCRRAGFGLVRTRTLETVPVVRQDDP